MEKHPFYLEVTGTILELSKCGNASILIMPWSFWKSCGVPDRKLASQSF
jgi:hypothetical protein